ncbi:MAG: DUF1801 domain-containing protein [Chlorobium sp.]
MTSDRITNFLEALSVFGEERYNLVQSLRSEVLGLDDSISEEVKYGGILFSAVKPFCGIFSYSKHISLEFGDGASLPDKFGVLEGGGKLRRHIKLLKQEEIVSRHVREYLELAFYAARRP